MSAVILLIGSVLVVAFVLGINIVTVQEGQRGVQVVRGQATGKVIEPGVRVGIRWWREIAVVKWAVIRAPVFRSVESGVPACFAGVPVWLKWRVQHADVLKFHRVAGVTTQTSDRTVEDVVIRPIFEAALKSLPGDWGETAARMNQSLREQGIVILSIEPQ